MTRRDWLSRIGVLALAGSLPALGRRALAQQPARPDSAAGDPLYRPDLVQERGVATARDNDATVTAVEHQLKCTCGCNLDIYTCRTTDFTCQYSPALHAEVLELKAAGSDAEAIVAAFVKKYGEQILMAPPAEGFNLAGYLVPGALVAAIGTLIAVVLLRRGRREVPTVGGPAPAEGASRSAADEAKLRQALSEVED